MKIIYLCIVLLAVIFIGGCTQYSGQQTRQLTTEPQPSGNTVEIIESGFSPNVLTIKVGETVTFVNKDSRQHWPASNVHPTHTAYPGSDIEKCGAGANIFDACNGLAQGETFSFTFDQRGSWEYHDHLNPRLIGTVEVQ